jgi:hypothetical protein
MSQLLFLKVIGNEEVLKSVKTVERYTETHSVSLNVEIYDGGIKVYDRDLLLLNIQVQL